MTDSHLYLLNRAGNSSILQAVHIMYLVWYVFMLSNTIWYTLFELRPFIAFDRYLNDGPN